MRRILRRSWDVGGSVDDDDDDDDDVAAVIETSMVVVADTFIVFTEDLQKQERKSREQM